MLQDIISSDFLTRTELQAAQVLIVDDEIANVRVLEQMLEKWGCVNVRSTTDPRQALPLFQEQQPDIILLDLMMPELDGFGVMEQLRPLIPSGTYLPILVLTADTTMPTKHKTLAMGAKDFLTKPFNQVELSLRIGNLIESRFLHQRVHNHNRLLDAQVHERTRELELSQLELEKAQIEILERLAQAAEWRDDDTGHHTKRVGHTAGLIAQALGLPEEEAELIRLTAPLHDVGKIGIHDDILLKPGKLTEVEFEAMTQHTVIGARMLANGHSELVRKAECIALTHHEKWNGFGYPHKLKAEEIPIEGRIVAVADVFDALTHERPYKKAWAVENAITEIARQSGQQFDPGVVEAFLRLPHDTLI